jgi:gamma-glutamyltranspeptidase/glutathione hydrolase
MAPTILRRDGAPVLILGSPGGSRIIPYVAKTIVAMVDWGLDPQAALDLAHLVNRFGTYELEDRAAGLALDLRASGYEVEISDLTSGLHVIDIGVRLRGGADPRREGLAYGE